MFPTLEKKLLAEAVGTYDFRPARLGDIEALVALYGEYFAESYLPGQGLVYAPQRAWAHLFSVINRGKVPHVLAFVKGRDELAGLISYSLNQDFTEQPFANLEKFYVRKPWRRSPVARVLLMLCLDLVRSDGAVAFNATLNSGMTETASARNLFTKLGFDPVDGVILTRRI
jgi:GNAT superfamily N-acetyltransferase